jgi:hypothetical protein
MGEGAQGEKGSVIRSVPRGMICFFRRRNKKKKEQLRTAKRREGKAG